MDREELVPFPVSSLWAAGSTPYSFMMFTTGYRLIVQIPSFFSSPNTRGSLRRSP